MNHFFKTAFICSFLFVFFLTFEEDRSFAWEDAGFPIHKAILQGDLAAAKEMLDWDQDVNAPMQLSGVTPLHIAAQIGTIETARILLRRGAKINSRDVTGHTPLHFAAKAGRPEMIEFLLHHGADSSAQDLLGFTPFHCLIWATADFDHPTQRHPEAARILLRYGSRLDIPNSGGATAYDLIKWNRFGVRRKLWQVIQANYVRNKVENSRLNVSSQ